MPQYVPKYQRIIADIREQVTAGELGPGDALPSTRELAERYRCGQSTVRQAITILLSTGELEGQQGVAVRVPGGPAL